MKAENADAGQEITTEQLDEWKRLCDEATKGPWYRMHDEPGSANPKCQCAQVWSKSGDLPVAYCDTSDDMHPSLSKDQQMKNAAFVAAARTALSALIAAYERLRGRYAEMHRRAQLAESAAATKVEECQRKGWSLGRGLAVWGLTKAQRENEELRAEVESLRGLIESHAPEGRNITNAEHLEITTKLRERVERLQEEKGRLVDFLRKDTGDLNAEALANIRAMLTEHGVSFASFVDDHVRNALVERWAARERVAELEKQLAATTTKEVT